MSRRKQRKTIWMRELRLRRGLTCEEVAKATHWSITTIVGSELGTRNSRKGTAFWESMVEFYGVPEADLRRKME